MATPAAVVPGLGALPVVLDVLVGALDAWLLYWIYKTGRVLLEPRKLKLLPDEMGVLDQLQSLNPLSDPINALSQPLNSLATLLFGWSSPYGVLRLNWTYSTIVSQCIQSWRDGIGMPTYPSGKYQLSPTYSGGENGFVTGWYIGDSSYNFPPEGAPMRLSSYYLVGWNGGGSIVFDQE